MTEHRVDVHRVVQAPVQRVWDVLTDVAHADQTLSGVTRVEPVTEGPYRVGTRWRETRRMLGKEATELMQVTVVEEPTRTVVEADASGVHYVTEFTLSPAGAGATQVLLRFTAVQGRTNLAQRVLAPVVGRLGAKAAEKMLAKDLADIAAVAERR